MEHVIEPELRGITPRRITLSSASRFNSFAFWVIFPVMAIVLWCAGPGPMWFGTTVQAVVRGKTATWVTSRSGGNWKYEVRLAYSFGNKRYLETGDVEEPAQYDRITVGETVPVTLYAPVPMFPHVDIGNFEALWTGFLAFVVMAEIALIQLVPRRVQRHRGLLRDGIPTIAHVTYAPSAENRFGQMQYEFEVDGSRYTGSALVSAACVKKISPGTKLTVLYSRSDPRINLAYGYEGCYHVTGC